MKKSLSEQLARRLAKEMGAKMRRDNMNRVMVVSLGEKRQEFWQGSWQHVVIWLRKEETERLLAAKAQGKKQTV